MPLRLFSCLFVIILPFQYALTQSDVTFLPEGSLFPPLISHSQEPRIGVRKEVGTSRMRLDIGSTLDIIEWRASDGAVTARVGIDFFTYALTTSADGLRLQVDAVDGFFGGHVVLVNQHESGGVSIRLRLLHLSGHFLDGHYDETLGWKDGRSPIPFTRDFGEVIGKMGFVFDGWNVSLFGGFSYATLVRPEEIKRLQYITGVESYSARILGPVFGKPCNIYGAYTLVVLGTPAWQGQHSVEVGVKFGSMRGNGIRLYGSYFTGPDLFSQYYDLQRRYWGLGFAFDFW